MPANSKQGGDWRIEKCAYCNGSGRDRWDLLSPLSTCSACGGRGVQRIQAPFRTCAHCRGTGNHPHLRVTCTACHGLGLVHVPTDAPLCSVCAGSGVEPGSGLDLTCLACGGTGWQVAEKAAKEFV